MKFAELTPTLATIERGLFGSQESTVPLQELAAENAAPPIEPSSALLSMIARRVAAAEENRGDASEPKAGDLWWLRLDANAEQPVALLIDKLDPETAQGWLVSSESAYASDRDWVLQEDDIQGSLDPRLGMVQLWNAVVVTRNRLTDRAGRLQPKALADIRVVTNAPTPSDTVEPEPGRVGLVETQGVAWVSGTPLGSEDVRHGYQNLYARFAKAVALRPLAQPGVASVSADTLPASESPQNNVVDIGSRRAQRRSWINGDFWRGAGIAAAIVLAVGIPLTHMQHKTGGADQNQVAVMRGVEHQGKTVRFDVHFMQTANLAEISALLQQAHLQITAGPQPDGTYVLSVDAADAASAQKAIDGSSLVVTWSEHRP